MALKLWWILEMGLAISGTLQTCIRDHPQKMSSQTLYFWGTLPSLVSSNLLVNVSFLGIFCTPLPPPLGKRLLWMSLRIKNIPRFFKGMLLYPTYPLTLAMQSRCTQYFCLWQVVSESFSFTMLAACTPAKPL